MHIRKLSLSGHPLGQWSMMWPVLNSHSIRYQPAIGPHWLVVFTVPLSEAPLAAHMNLKHDTIQS